MGKAGAEEAEVRSKKPNYNNKKKKLQQGDRGLTYSRWLLNINNLDQG